MGCGCVAPTSPAAMHPPVQLPCTQPYCHIAHWRVQGITHAHPVTAVPPPQWLWVCQMRIHAGISLTPKPRIHTGISLTPKPRIHAGITLTPKPRIHAGISLTPKPRIHAGISLTPKPH